VSAENTKFEFPVDERARVSAVITRPRVSRAALVLAHGAGAGMEHPFMVALADALADQHICSLRFQFPYMQKGLKRPDTPEVAQRAVRAAVGEATRRCTGLPLFAGGKSFGGRMTSSAQADEPLPGVRGLVFFGFPLHPAGKPSLKRADHLGQVSIPLLFLQGTRDALADIGLMRHVVSRLGERVSLEVFEDADHSFHVRTRSGSTDVAVLEALAGRAATWMIAAA
jgi:predicted alpha/beta-hydrolase family hydrolase